MKYYFFWSGECSQWYPSKFVIDGVKFNCCEQYMMYKKAELFDDVETMKVIMRTSDPKKQKALGRQVKNFDVAVWESKARQIVYDANLAKFAQNKDLHDWLLSVDCDLFVEASPYDTIWGIGYGEENAMANINKWGRNWLGITITDVRNDLQ